MKTTIRKQQGGVPTGGSTNDALIKNSNADYDDDFAPQAGGGSGLYSVNADETVITWFTSQLRAPFTGGFWTCSFSPIQYGNASIDDAAGNFAAYITNGLSSIDPSTTIPFNSTKDWKLKFRISNTSGVGTSPLAGGVRWGFAGVASGTPNGVFDGNITDVKERYGFAFYNQRIYTIVADGSTVSAFDAGAYTTTASLGLEIIYNSSGTVDFYIDGSLVKSEALLTQTATPIKPCHSGANGSGGGAGGPISNLVFSQEV